MNRFRRLLLIAAINDYDPFPPPLFSADLLARVCMYAYTRNNGACIEKRSLERETERGVQWRSTKRGEEEVSFRSIFKTRASIFHLLFSSRHWDEMERTRLERKEGRKGGEKANLEELNFSRIDLKSAAKSVGSRQATKVGYAQVFVARASLSGGES